MNRTKWNIFIDSGIFIVFLALAVSGLVMAFVLPEGSGGRGAGHGGALTLWTMSRHEWGDIHLWLGLSLLSLVTIHLLLHWNWIKAVTRGKNAAKARIRSVTATAALAALLAAAAAPFFSPLRTSPSEATGITSEITGSMTLGQFEAVTGISHDRVVRTLNLDPSTDRDRRLGRLAQAHGLTLADFRHLAEASHRDH